MNILFDIGHPAHVHLFKNFIKYLRNNEHDIVVVSRNKGLTNKLLRHFKIDFVSLTDPMKGSLGMLKEVLVRDFKIYKLHRKYQFDVAFGTSVSIGHLSLLSKARSYVFNEDDDEVVPLFVFTAYPFATKIINPNIVERKYFVGKNVRYKSYQKLAYLHPNVFTPRKHILKDYDLDPYKYIIIRKSSLTAHHDKEGGGLNKYVWDKLIRKLGKYKLIISRESLHTHEIKPWHMHDLLAYAKMLVSDSLSMSVEAAVLGTPSLRYNVFEGRSSILNEIEKRYKLGYGFSANKGEYKKLFMKLDILMKMKNLEKVWKAKRKKLLEDKCDLNKWMIHYFEESIKPKFLEK